jgi:hypothetical protein
MDPERKNIKLTPDFSNRNIEQKENFFNKSSFQEGILDYQFIIASAEGTDMFRSLKDYLEQFYSKKRSLHSIEQKSKILGFAFSAAKYRDPSIVFEILIKEGLMSDNPSKLNAFLRWTNGKRNFIEPALAKVNNPIEQKLGINVDPKKEIHQLFLFKQLTKAIRAKNPFQAYKIAEQCCGQTVDITHGTWKSELKDILRTLEIGSSEGEHHYYGNGVYVGVNGGFRDWGEKFLIYIRNFPTEKLLPVINTEETMANIPTDKIELQNLKRFDDLVGLFPDEDFFIPPNLIEATPIFDTKSYRFPGFKKPVDSETLRQIDKLLGLVKVKKVYDSNFYEIYYRVYVKDKRPLVCMAVMICLNKIGEIVWDE